MWLWASPQAGPALASRDLGRILRVYRRINGLSQHKLAELLGFDKTYISMIETGRRTISDVTTRRKIARTLGLPMHVLGVTEADDNDADFAAMVQFADSTLRLAEIARQAGRAVEAVNKLWPLVARLEARAAEGRTERDTLVLLGHARLALGVSLGTVLPEERLVAAVGWTSKALMVAERLDDNAFLARTLRMHGNELRKAGRTAAAVARLHHATHISLDSEGQGTAYALLARAAGERGDSALFDHAVDIYRDLLDHDSGRGMLFNPFTFREIHLRGLLSTHRPAEAVRLLRIEHPGDQPVAPQWHIIERVTAGQVLVAAREPDGAEESLRAAVDAAEVHRMPHQVQRAIRAVDRGGLHNVVADGHASLQRLRVLLAPQDLAPVDA
ncbi:MAG: helix-turn-helix domain-containing protein [Actinomycetota bacterium]|nr:helix-turn-helix domain-containing protein [Actinomycetota bacterium]